MEIEKITMEYIPAKTIVTKTKSAEWFGTDYNMNIYRGCSHGCIYCDSRSDCYHIEDFDRIRVKQDALRIIEDDLSKKRKKGVVATGAMSDPYNPYEKDMNLTRGALGLINKYRFGVAIDTKGVLVKRDIDILKEIQTHSPVIIKITITTADDDISKIVEPNAPSSSQRFETVRTLSASGLYVGILMMPILPFIEDTDENIIGIVHRAKDAGASFVYPAMGTTMRSGNREYFYNKLDRHFPGLRAKYERYYGDRYNCPSPRAKKLWSVFTEECEKTGLRYRMGDIVAGYRGGYSTDATEQLDLFG
jgi:DNA repair photolyase